MHSVAADEVRWGSAGEHRHGGSSGESPGPEFPLRAARLDSIKSQDISEECLAHILSCFPFPSPKPGRKINFHSRTKLHQKEPSSSETADLAVKARPSPVPLAGKKKKKKDQKGIDLNPGIGPCSALEFMVLKSLDLTLAPVSIDCWLKERLKKWVQLSGHEGTIIPASDRTLWKKGGGGDNSETRAYVKLMEDVCRPFVPKFYNEVEHNGEFFIEIEDLTCQFVEPAVMDVKVGTRTFSESEVEKPTKRRDLYEKMIALKPDEPSEEEQAEGAITKLRYMQFRERESSSATLGFRIEAMKLSEGSLEKDFQRVRTRDQILELLQRFLGPESEARRMAIVQRLKEIRATVEVSEFFRRHEMIGSSLLIVYDAHRVGVWMIDFAKTLALPDGRFLDHRSRWELGNHEDGYLLGLDSLIQMLEEQGETGKGAEGVTGSSEALQG